MRTIVLNQPLDWIEIVEIAQARAQFVLSPAASARIEHARSLVDVIVERDMRAYGVNTGVGALSDVVVPRARQRDLSHNILMSHAVGVGAPLGIAEVRAIIAAAINNFAHGYSGLRLCLVERFVDLLNAGYTPMTRGRGSVGYLSHMAQIALVLVGHGTVDFRGTRLSAAAALKGLGAEPAELRAKEGLSLVNGTPCATGLACLAIARAKHLLDWADAISAMTFEVQRGQVKGVSSAALALRVSAGLGEVVANLDRWLAGSGILTEARGSRTQDALSLRAIPQVHGAVRDVWAEAVACIRRELNSVTDNPIVTGSIDVPEVHSQAHAVGAGLGLAMDALAVAMAQLGSIVERRIDRMVNPLVSGLPAFLAEANGVASGFMIAQYTAVSLVGENRRLASPAALDGGVTSGLQEDILGHATQSALKLLSILDNVQTLMAIEYLAAGQSYDLLETGGQPAPGTRSLHRALRARVAPYADDRPLGDDIETISEMIGLTVASELHASGFALAPSAGGLKLVAC
jgi:histidine ammonia-lyase